MSKLLGKHNVEVMQDDMKGGGPMVCAPRCLVGCDTVVVVVVVAE
jgi:hypothetical protein